MAATKKIKMEPENGLAMIRAINALYRLITFIGKKPKINTKYKRREFTGQDTWHGPIEDVCSKTKVNLFIIINLKGLNICLKHQCAMTITSELMLGNYNKQIYQKCKYYHCVIEIKNFFKENPFICNICFKLIQNNNKTNPQIYII